MPIAKQVPTIAPFGHPFYVMAKPVGSSCNLSCSYCYFLTKAKGRMDERLLEEFIRQNIEAQTQPEVLFTWHGGEPLLLPLSYYARAIELQQKYAQGRHIDNCLQTNGTLLTDEWCAFFREHNFLIGISIDGPEWMHNANRQQFDATLRGIRLLQKHGVMWNAMATVNSTNGSHPTEFYRFFKELGCEYLQFTPVVETRSSGTQAAFQGNADNVSREHFSVTPETVSPQQWGDFIIGVFDEWVKEDVGRVFVQLFEATLANWVGVEPGVCSLSKGCGLSPALQPDGALYCCDHFVYDDYKLGNIHEQTLTQMVYGERQQAFSRLKMEALSQRCRRCDYLFACNGECLRNRFLPDHENYLCEGYCRYFEHVTPFMNDMAKRLT